MRLRGSILLQTGSPRGRGSMKTTTGFLHRMSHVERKAMHLWIGAPWKETCMKRSRWIQMARLDGCMSSTAAIWGASGPAATCRTTRVSPAPSSKKQFGSAIKASGVPALEMSLFVSRMMSHIDLCRGRVYPTGCAHRTVPLLGCIQDSGSSILPGRVRSDV